MKFQLTKICIGNIKELTKPTGRLIPYQDEVPLIEIRGYLYVRLDDIKKISGKMRLKRILRLEEQKRPIPIDGEFIMDSTPVLFGKRKDHAVDSESVKKVYPRATEYHFKTIRKIRKDIEYKMKNNNTSF